MASVRMRSFNCSLQSSMLSQGNALLRINDIFKWPSVSAQAGLSRTTLSFQRGFLPLLRVRLASGESSAISFLSGQYFSSSSVVKSTLDYSVKSVCVRDIFCRAHSRHSALYMLLMENFEHFAQVVEECMNRAMASHSFKDPLCLAFRIPSGSEVLTCLADIIYEFVHAFFFRS